jgi:signal transduction histidine kinase
LTALCQNGPRPHVLDREENNSGGGLPTARWSPRGRAEQRRTIGIDLIVVVLAWAVTVLVILLPAGRVALGNETAGAIIITARGMAELLASCLITGRFRHTASRTDAIAAAGLGIMAVADLTFTLGRATVAPDAISTAPVLPYQLVGAGMLAVAAFTPERALVKRPRRRLVVGATAAPALFVLALQQANIVPLAVPAGGSEPVEIVVLRLAAFGLLAAAAAGFARRRSPPADAMRPWLTAALTLAALAQAHRVAVPAPAAAVFTWTHVLQLAALGALVRGCVAEVSSYQARIAELAVRDERRRMARDLHDGLAQEVAFIASQTKYLAGRTRDDRMSLIAASAERALDDSRFLIGTLTRAAVLPLSASIAMQAEEFARRWGLKIELRLDDADVAPDKRQAILRILGEALFNAARYAEASTIRIALGTIGEGVLLAVRDDGRGFDPEQVDGAGFGIRSMRERAQLLGAELRLESKPGQGTRVELALP